jgi:uncharacterized protein DUF6152
VKEDTGSVVTWGCEGGSPIALSRRGFKKNDIKLGDTVTVDGYPAKGGSQLMDARRITLTDGRSFYAARLATVAQATRPHKRQTNIGGQPECGLRTTGAFPGELPAPSQWRDQRRCPF